MQVIRANEAVVSNASIWDTEQLLPPELRSARQWSAAARDTMPIESFMHLHLGIDSTGLDPGLQCHHLFVHDWADISAPQNVCIASIPTVFDKSLAPDGKAVVHAYTAANEPWEMWEGLDTRSEEYKGLKRERAEVLYTSLERVCTPP
jgi:phytoene dehydrogenase-like protein